MPQSSEAKDHFPEKKLEKNNPVEQKSALKNGSQ